MVNDEFQNKINDYVARITHTKNMYLDAAAKYALSLGYDIRQLTFQAKNLTLLGMMRLESISFYNLPIATVSEFTAANLGEVTISMFRHKMFLARDIHERELAQMRRSQNGSRR